jgi:hypothetical protein
LARVSGLSICTSTAPAGTFWPTFDRDRLDPPIDTRGYIEAWCIDLTLYEKWFRSKEIENRKRDDG